jgi:hypothetical protein
MLVILERPSPIGVRRWAIGIVGVCAVAALFQYWSLDGLGGVLFSALFREDTEYASGYSDRAFRRVKQNMSEETVRQILGSPLVETWIYASVPDPGCFMVSFERERVLDSDFRGCDELGIRKGMHKAEATARLKAPEEIWWHFSRSPGHTHYRVRSVKFLNRHVVEIHSGFYVD